MTIYGPSPIIGSDDKFHYVYRITNLVENKHYYGSRTSKINPYDDLGKKYFSSAYTNSWIKSDQKQNSQNYKYKILRTFATRKEAFEFECMLHEKFNVSISESFYNAANQNGLDFQFSAIGKVPVKSKNGKRYLVDKTDERYISGELIPINKNRIPVIDSENNLYMVDRDDERISSGELVKSHLMTFKDSAGNHHFVDNKDERVLSGELYSPSKGTISVVDKNGKYFRVDKNDERYISGELVGCSKNMVSVIDKSGNHLMIYKNDERYISGELIPRTTGINNPSFKHYRMTPWGIFSSKNALQPEIHGKTLEHWCGRDNNVIITKSRYSSAKKLQETFGPDCIGKTYKELGFGNLTKEEYQLLQSNS